jgi:hypothetical protein
MTSQISACCGDTAIADLVTERNRNSMADDTFAILPAELVEQIGLELAKIVQCGQDIENEMERATVQVRTLRNLTLVNTRFNHIFIPRLYRQVVLHTANSKSSFSKYTSGN